MEQGYVPLSFSAGGGELTATSPQNANVAPPGVYMLFIVDDAGVASVAKMIQIGSASPPPPPPPPPPPNNPPTITLDQPANGATFTAPATVHLAATTSDPGGHVWVVEFYSNGTKIGEDQTAPFTFDWSGDGAGTHALTAKATDNDGASTTTSPTTITVTGAPPPPNQPPTVTLTQPANGAKFTAPATVSLAATASDTGGTVTKVQFYNGTTKLGEDTTSPYTYTWSGVAAGTYPLTAKAIDNDGAVTTTTPARTITVNALPTASITSPANEAVFPRRPTITISATATDADGTVTSVEFRDGTRVLGRDTTAPYAYTWSNVASGTHTLRVRATDNAGAATTSGPVGIRVR
jgi:hypothetical protein